LKCLNHVFVSSDVSGFVKFWHYPSKSCLYTIVDSFTEPLCLDLNFNNSKLTIGGYNSALSVYDISTKKLISTLESSNTHSIMDGHVSRVFCVKYNPIEENQIFSGGWDNTVHIWDDRINNSQK
jgi:COMPASS component SWD3